jgi:hypothetical protein
MLLFSLIGRLKVSRILDGSEIADLIHSWFLSNSILSDFRLSVSSFFAR